MPKRLVLFVLGLICVWGTMGRTVWAQTPDEPEPKQEAPAPEKDFFRHVLEDQKRIWTAPFHLRRRDREGVLGFGLVTAGLIAVDRRASGEVDRNGSLLPVSHAFSQGGSIFATIGTVGAFYIGGRVAGDRRARETGVLAAESLLDTAIVTEALKFATRRPRPNTGNGHGQFFRGGNAFPSGHSSSIWSVATVVSYEYADHPLIRYGALAAAAAVSLSRFSGRNHFLSDVLVGSAIGFYIGRFVFHTRHVTEADTDPAAPHVSRWRPSVLPVYDARSRTYGAMAAWNF